MLTQAQNEKAIRTLASEFHRASNSHAKITDFLRCTFKTYLSEGFELPEADIAIENAAKDIIQMWEAVCSNPKKCEIRKRNIASYKTLQNRITRKLNKELDNGLRALIVKDGEIIEAQLKKAKSKGGEEGSEEGSGNTSTDAPNIVKSLGNFDILATLTDLLPKVNGEEQVAVQAGIDALIKLDNLTTEATFIPMTHEEEAHAERMHP